jgi:hypothetical protein
VVLGLVALLQPECVSAQSSIVLDEPYCDCRINFERIVTLGTFDGPGALPGSIRQVARGWDGGYYLVPWQDPMIRRFDADGTPVGTVGQAGEGPGEFGNIARIAFVEDSLLVWDRGNARLSVFDSNLELHRTMPLKAHIEHGVHIPGRRLPRQWHHRGRRRRMGTIRGAHPGWSDRVQPGRSRDGPWSAAQTLAEDVGEWARRRVVSKRHRIQSPILGFGRDSTSGADS